MKVFSRRSSLWILDPSHPLDANHLVCVVLLRFKGLQRGEWFKGGNYNSQLDLTSWYTPLKLTVRTWKWMLGIRSFPFLLGYMAHFQVRLLLVLGRVHFTKIIFMNKRFHCPISPQHLDCCNGFLSFSCSCFLRAPCRLQCIFQLLLGGVWTVVLATEERIHLTGFLDVESWIFFGKMWMLSVVRMPIFLAISFFTSSCFCSYVI